METTSPYTPPQTELVGDQEQYGEVRIFSASGRIGRLRYIAYSMGITMLVYLVMGAIFAVASMSMEREQAAIVLSLVTLLGMLVALVITVLLTVQRCHDFDTTGWLSLTLILPLVPLIFWFIPGTQGGNRFGPRPPPNKGAAIIIVAILILIVIISILAAIAIPAYQAYVEQAAAAANGM
jgi:uncharacterized membrane protein YhaH (DUF805 family)